MQRFACLGLGCLALLAWGRGTMAVSNKDEDPGIAHLEGGAYAYQKGAYDIALDELKPIAEQGNPAAQNYLGYMYAHGEGVRKDPKEAVKWYLKSALQGLSSAQTNLASMYQNGRGVKKNLKEARKWYLKAAAQGEPNAQNSLGIIYEAGIGVEPNDAMAIKWYQKAANLRHTEAELHLGSMYYLGKGVDQNYVQAYKWFYLAGASDRQEPIEVVGEVTKAREMVVQLLTPTELTKAQHLAYSWAAKHPLPPRLIPKGRWNTLGSVITP